METSSSGRRSSPLHESQGGTSEPWTWTATLRGATNDDVGVGDGGKGDAGDGARSTGLPLADDLPDSEQQVLRSLWQSPGSGCDMGSALLVADDASEASLRRRRDLAQRRATST